MAQTKINSNQVDLSNLTGVWTPDNLKAGSNISITEGLNNVLLPSQTPVLFHFDGNNTNSGNGTGITWNTNPSYSTAYPKFGSAAATGNPGFSISGEMSNLLNSSSPYSIDVWARTPAEGLYFGFMNTSWSPILRLIVDTNTKEVNLYTGTSHKFYCEDIAVDTYIHYALTHNGNGIFDVYANGKKVGRVDIGANPSGLKYFSYDGGSSHNAVFDEFAIHNYARFTGDSFALQTQAYVISNETPAPYYQINADLSSKQSNPNVIQDLTSTSITLSNAAANTIYKYGTLTSLTITANETSNQETLIYFTAGSNITTSFPSSLKWANGNYMVFVPNTDYVISIVHNIACWASY